MGNLRQKYQKSWDWTRTQSADGYETTEENTTCQATKKKKE